MHALEQVFAEVVTGGLKRKSIKRCSRWAQEYRVLKGKKLTFVKHPWSRAMHDSTASFNAGMKAAQMAYSETMLDCTFFKMDIEGVNCLYALPNQNPDAAQFSASRFDPALEESEHLRKMFSDAKGVKNVGHKRAGAANLWIRGSQSRIGFKAIDPSFVVLDEVDEMNKENIQLAFRRTDGQEVSSIWAISTPTTPEFGIHKMFLTTTQESWYFQCPSCWKEVTLEFPECLVIIGESLTDPRIYESHIICPLCKKRIEHEDKIKSQIETGRWIPRAPDANSDRRGFYINQLSSCVKKPWKIAETAIEAESSPTAEQELWNSIAGLPHVVDGAQIDDNHIAKCMEGVTRRMNDPPPSCKTVTMGVDVGTKWLHYEIDAWKIPKPGPDINMAALCEIIRVGKVERFDEIYQLMREWQIQYLVIDKQPEERAVHELCCRAWGRAKRCHYSTGVGSRKMVIAPQDDEHLISVNRTYWLDTSLGRIRSGRIKFPLDIPQEYLKHIKNLIKQYKDNANGDDISKYVCKEGRDDHYAHTRNYSEMALPLSASMATNQNIRSFL
jgi:hypothetical protein